MRTVAVVGFENPFWVVVPLCVVPGFSGLPEVGSEGALELDGVTDRRRKSLRRVEGD